MEHNKVNTIMQLIQLELGKIHTYIIKEGGAEQNKKGANHWGDVSDMCSKGQVRWRRKGQHERTDTSGKGAKRGRPHVSA